MPIVAIVEEDRLDPARLADGIARALALGGSRGVTPFRLDGAEETARHLVARLEAVE